MPRRIPTYRLHKPTQQAVVTLDGKDHYLGRHGSPESRGKYDRLIAEWRLRREPDVDEGILIDELIAKFLDHAQSYYRKHGEPTSEIVSFRLALRPLHEHFGPLPAKDLGPKALKVVRQGWIDVGLSRSGCNRRVGLIRRMMKWGVAEELVPATVLVALQAIAPLRRGRSVARETAPVRPIGDADIDAVRPHVGRQVWAMIELQRLTGMRPGEVTRMRTGDIDRSGPIWVYRPHWYKTEHHDRPRVIPMGPRAQDVLRPFLKADPIAYLFRPDEAETERKVAMRATRKSPVPPSQRDRSRPGPRRRPGDRYGTPAYTRAISRGCLKAGVPPWTPNRIRHTAATRLRKDFGLDVARAILGHSSPVMTEVYAELDREKAFEIMAKIG